MRLVDFLIALLEAHAETLKRLAALFGEDNLLQLLEMAGDEAAEAARPEPAKPEMLAKLFEDPSPITATDSTYAELEGAVHDFKLPAVLQFHLWAYPHYRAFIESPLDLNARVIGPGGDAGMVLVNEAVAQAEEWVRKLPMSDLVRDQASRAAHVPWLRFRTQVLKRIGKRPMGPVY